MNKEVHEKKVQINKRQKRLSRDQLEALDKSELIDRFVQLQAHNYQLKNILQKKLSEEDKQYAEYMQLYNEDPHQQVDTEKDAMLENMKKPKFKKRKFDFENCHKRHVLLKVMYFGWDYQGLAIQEHSNATIEYHLFNALTRSCLIESRETSNYHRCGRTDKEVSAFCQVISIDLRSKFPEDEQAMEESIANEINYCDLLNRILPTNIQCVAWMPLRSKVYSARFDCERRTYRYFFPQGDLNIRNMQEACKLLERHTDFRNFCKMDVHNGVTTFVRNLEKAEVHLCPNQMENESKGYLMYFLEIKANAFLWHQIRCIMAVLLLIGQEKETPDVISTLLDVKTNPCKPQYTPAIGLPLNLYNCEFRSYSVQEKTQESVNQNADGKTLNSNDEVPPHTAQWHYNKESLAKLIETIQKEWCLFSIKCSMIRNVLHSLENTFATQFSTKEVLTAQIHPLQDSIRTKNYQNLLERKRCESLENRIEHFVKKQRLIVTDGQSTH